MEANDPFGSWRMIFGRSEVFRPGRIVASGTEERQNGGDGARLLKQGNSEQRQI